MKKIGVIGPGAIGRLFAFFLASAGYDVLLVCRREAQAKAFSEQGLTYVDLEGRAHHLAVEATTGDSERLAEVHGVIVTVKSYDTAAAARQIGALNRKVPVLSLQNGLGNAQTLARDVAQEQIAVALTTHGAIAEGEAKVWHKGRGQTVIGAIEAGSEVADWWADVLASCAPVITPSAEIQREIWRKAMVNIGINPFTALLGVKNGQLLREPDVLPLMRAAVEEAEAVAKLAGVELSDSMERVLDVCRHTAENTSSMLQDVRFGRRTEIDAMCGVIVQIAEAAGLSVPHNLFLKNFIKKCETNRFELTSLELKRLFEAFRADL